MKFLIFIIMMTASCRQDHDFAGKTKVKPGTTTTKCHAVPDEGDMILFYKDGELVDYQPVPR